MSEWRNRSVPPSLPALPGKGEGGREGVGKGAAGGKGGPGNWEGVHLIHPGIEGSYFNPNPSIIILDSVFESYAGPEEFILPQSHTPPSSIPLPPGLCMACLPSVQALFQVREGFRILFEEFQVRIR